MAKTENHSINIESRTPFGQNLLERKPTGKGLAAIYRQEIIQDVTLFTSQPAANFYDKLFSSLVFTLPCAATGRRGFSKKALLCAFICKNKFPKKNHPKSAPDRALGVHSASNQHNERKYEFYWGYKTMCWWTASLGFSSVNKRLPPTRQILLWHWISVRRPTAICL